MTNYILDPKFIARLPGWFSLADFAREMGINQQKARYAIRDFMSAGMVERRISNPGESANVLRYEYGFVTAKIGKASDDTHAN